MDLAHKTGVIRVLSKAPNIEFAYLFGSAARGQTRCDSDIDVAVSGDEPDVLALMTQLGAELGRDVHVVDLKKTDSYTMTQSILRDGILVYQREPGLAGKWLARAYLSVETDAATFERINAAYLKRVAGGS